MVQFRDIKLKREKEQSAKQDKVYLYRAVLTDALGNQSSSDPLNNVWFNQTEKKVYHRKFGSGPPTPIYCKLVSTPYVGLPVYCGYDGLSNQIQVLEVDKLPQDVGGDPGGWDNTAPEDLEPGGIKAMWLYTKAIVPLATFPTASTGLKVTVNPGDYPYQGTRKTFAGQVGKDLSASQPSAGQWRYVGLYLDSANTLQAVNGTAVAITSQPPEPTWPAGSFRLSVVRIANPQTSIVFGRDTSIDNDILDRRMLWVDTLSFSGWPFAKVLTVSTTDPSADYTTITAALAAASPGYGIGLDSETFNESITISVSDISIFSLSPRQAVIASNSASSTVTIAAQDTTLYNLQIDNTASGTSQAVRVTTGGTNMLLDRCIISKGAGGVASGVKIEKGSDHLIRDCTISTTAASTNYGVFADTDISSTTILGGKIQGTTFAIRVNQGSSSISVLYPILSTTTPYQASAGTISGWYFDLNHILRTIEGSSINDGVWLLDESGNLKTKYSTLPLAVAAASAGDAIYLSPDTYDLSTTSLNPTVAITIFGDSPQSTIITGSGTGATIAIGAAGCTLRNLTIKHTAANTLAGPVASDQNNTVIENCILDKTSGATTTAYGYFAYGSVSHRLTNVRISVTAGTSKYGIFNNANSPTILVEGGQIGGDTADIYSDQAGAAITLSFPILSNGLRSWAGTLAGWYLDANDKPVGIERAPVAVKSPTTDVMRVDAASDSDFVSTIATLPGGAVLTYGAVTFGAAANLVPNSTSALAKMVLHNTITGTDALISNCVTGTSTITLTANVPAGWAAGDAITIRSQTNTATPITAGCYCIDFEFTAADWDTPGKFMEAYCSIRDTGAAGARMAFHPYEANSASKLKLFRTQVSNLFFDYGLPPLPIISNRFCMTWDATGAGTFTIIVRLAAEGVAV